MKMAEWIRLFIGGVLILTGVFFMLVTMFGAYKFKFVLNRMHSAAMGDTLGIGACLLGLIIICGFTFTSLKLMLVIVLLWLASPVGSHLISRLEVTTNEKIEDECEVRDIDEK